MNRLKVKGGLLCLWQIQRNRHNISFEDWVEFINDIIKQLRECESNNDKRI